MATIWVSGGQDRHVPIPKALAVGPGDTAIVLGRAGMPKSIEIDDGHPYTQRALRNGDLVRSKPPAQAVERKE
jgi:hypothetical protein